MLRENVRTKLAMLPDYDLVDVSREANIGGLSAFMYFSTVSSVYDPAPGQIHAWTGP